MRGPDERAPGRCASVAPRRPLLKKLEQSLNEDSKVLTAFLRDPASILKQEGIELSAEQVSSIKSQMGAMRLGKLLKLLARLE
jgi:hypothetical protein